MIELLLEAESALTIGLLDRAEILYRQVAAADPRNAIAVVGLARVTLERGDEPGALKLARRALAIDPENSVARRMVQRLQEVLAFRGAEVPAPLGSADEAPDRPATSQAAPSAPATGVPASAAPATQRRSLIDRLLRRR